jgi:hypothetical protein
MSRLSDLLNPTPSTSQESPSTKQTDNSNDNKPLPKSHNRNQSITSPLEALAIAATTSSSEPGLTHATNPPALSTAFDREKVLSKNSPITTKSHQLPSNTLSAPNEREAEHSTSAMASNNPILDGASQNLSNETETPSKSVPDEMDLQKENTSTHNETLTNGIASEQSIVQSLEIKKEESQGPVVPAESPGISSTAGKEEKQRSGSKADKKKGGTTTKKPVAKKRKIEVDSRADTPISQRSGTPNSIRGGKPVARGKKQNSATPAQSSPAPGEDNSEEGEDDDSDNELFCICRKPDDHTWMIGCDGGCNDWFHGRCVNMEQRNENLIDKYICMPEFLKENKRKQKSIANKSRS